MRNEVRADGGCLYCSADQGESHRPNCTKPSAGEKPGKVSEEAMEWATAQIPDVLAERDKMMDPSQGKDFREMLDSCKPAEKPGTEDCGCPPGYKEASGCSSSECPRGPKPGTEGIVGRLRRDCDERDADTHYVSSEVTADIRAVLAQLEELRDCVDYNRGVKEALNEELKRRNARIEELENALEPFALAADEFEDKPNAVCVQDIPVTVGDLRRARAALKSP